MYFILVIVGFIFLFDSVVFVVVSEKGFVEEEGIVFKLIREIFWVNICDCLVVGYFDVVYMFVLMLIVVSFNLISLLVLMIVLMVFGFGGNVIMVLIGFW